MQPAPRPRDLLQALAKAEDALKVCEDTLDTLNAMQVDHCQVSSRADDWAGTNYPAGPRRLNCATWHPGAQEQPDRGGGVRRGRRPQSTNCRAASGELIALGCRHWGG